MRTKRNTEAPKEELKEELKDEAPVETEAAVDPTVCQCDDDVYRRWDGDGVVERDSAGVTWYRCIRCGKKYS